MTTSTKPDIVPLCLKDLNPMTAGGTLSFTSPFGDHWQEPAYVCETCGTCYRAAAGYSEVHRAQRRIGDHLPSPLCGCGRAFMYLARVESDGRRVWECGCPACPKVRTTAPAGAE